MHSHAWQGPLVVVLTIFVTALLPRVLRRRPPLRVSPTGGTIQPDRVSAWFTVIGGAVMACVGVSAMVFAHAGFAGMFLALLGLACGGFMAPSLTALHQVHWTETGIEGPSRLFGPTLGTARTAIKWRDITHAGTTVTSYWYVEAADGRRIYWSYLYQGYGQLTMALRRHCPSINLPARMG